MCVLRAYGPKGVYVRHCLTLSLVWRMLQLVQPAYSLATNGQRAARLEEARTHQRARHAPTC